MQIEHKNMCIRKAKTRGHKIWQMPGKNPNVGNPLIKYSYYYSIVQ